MTVDTQVLAQRSSEFVRRRAGHLVTALVTFGFTILLYAGCNPRTLSCAVGMYPRILHPPDTMAIAWENEGTYFENDASHIPPTVRDRLTAMFSLSVPTCIPTLNFDDFLPVLQELGYPEIAYVVLRWTNQESSLSELRYELVLREEGDSYMVHTHEYPMAPGQ